MPPIVEHYLEWTTSVLIVFVAFFVAIFVDRSMVSNLHYRKFSDGIVDNILYENICRIVCH